ncbi:lipopolysaccharide transport system ATP-binding protein [Melaminivora alkalimesophila]|uniref:Lipopolysaccharide transport system ATP-binding protein n=2 Tax=Melaminivora alkalimesophila TaxID=1165852 RepID=A0A317RAW2_9BURK|nr:ABC transporter ATP-binding protein [Melaminivora alkalimesophila]PWW43738.1 lipopolysaccharide transport system ATP-binding protein [Melaminivora alkalimesophila]
MNPGQTPLVLRVQGVGKEYRLYASPRERFKALFSSRARHRSHWALRDVSFELRRGQCIGVVGDNGAGKSSLLKLLAGTMQPTTGTVERVGRVTAILELGAGFHPDFSGRDNLYFGGSLIGIDREEMARLEPEIVAFSELGEALDRPVKTYSSGMTVRLAFALVTAVQPDVLIIDEALAVGDQHFQKKCVERIMAFRDAGCTILFCSHSSYHIRHLCDQAIWLNGGRIAEMGPTEAVMGAYELHSRLRAGEGAADHSPAAALEGTQPAAGAPVSAGQEAAGHGANLLSVTISGLGEGTPPLLEGSDLVVTFIARGRGDECPNLGFMIEQSKGTGITSLATHEEGARPVRLPDGTWQAVLTFPQLPLHSGEYVVSAYLFDESGLVLYDAWLHYQHFRFVSPTLMPGLVRLPHTWT